MQKTLIETVGSNIRRLRLSRNISALELGEAVGVSQSAVSDWETHKKMPRAYTMDELESLVLDEIEKLRLDPNAYTPAVPTDNTAEISALESRLTHTSAALERLVELYIAGGFPLDALNSRREALESERGAIRALAIYLTILLHTTDMI